MNAWSDFDKDGDLDLAVSFAGGEIRLYRNDGIALKNGCRAAQYPCERKVKTLEVVQMAMNRRAFTSFVASLPALAHAFETQGQQRQAGASGAGAARTPALHTQAFELISRECRQIVSAAQPGQRVVGLSVAISIGEAIEYAECFGYADLEWQLPVTPTTRFRIGSISKLLTSIGMGILLERGKLDIDAPIARYVPYPQAGSKITLRQLASHTSGLPHYGDGLAENAGIPSGADGTYRGDLAVQRYPSLTAAMGKYKDRPLLFEPGTSYHYSSFGWNLIGAIIEQVTGGLFVDFMREQVFAPLEMEHTMEDDSRRIIPQRTGFYMAYPDGSFGNALHVEQSDLYPGGGYLSTPHDLLKLGLALRTGRPISAATWAELRKPGAVQDANGKSRYGLGWRNTVRAGQPVTGHIGSHAGCRAQFDMTTDSSVPAALAVMINTSSAGADAARDKIGESILEKILG